MKINTLIPYILIVSIFLANLIIYSGLIKLFFNGDSTIIAGVIAFIGAVIGGMIAYLGVNKTLEHRNRELFLHNATEKLMLLEILSDNYSEYVKKVENWENGLNNHFKIESQDRIDEVREISLRETRSLIIEIVKQLKVDKESMYKSMEYIEIEKLSVYQESLENLLQNKKPAEEDIRKGIDEIKNVFRVFYSSKKQLENKYKFHSERNGASY